MPGVGKDLVEIAALLIGVAFTALLITRANQTATVIQSAGTVFNDALRIVSGQSSGYGNAFSAF